MKYSAIRPTPTPSWTASSITPRASISLARACAGNAPDASRTLDLTNQKEAREITAREPQTGRHQPGTMGDFKSERWATSVRNHWATSSEYALGTMANLFG